MEIRITHEEFERLQKYIDLRAKDPCKSCSVNKNTCTGCTNKKSYDIECKDTYLDYIYGTPIQDYVNSAIHYTSLKKEQEELEEKLKSVKERMDAYRARFIVTD